MEFKSRGHVRSGNQRDRSDFFADGDRIRSFSSQFAKLHPVMQRHEADQASPLPRQHPAVVPTEQTWRAVRWRRSPFSILIVTPFTYELHTAASTSRLFDAKTKAINLENDLRAWAQVTQFCCLRRFYLSPITIEGTGRAGFN